MTRRFLLGLGASGALAAAGYGIGVEPGRLDVTWHAVGTPGGLPPLRIVQITDLHLKRVGRHERAVADAVHRLAPDLIVHTGDAVDRRRNLDALPSLLGLLPGAPALAIPGNWEHWAGVEMGRLRKLYERAGVRLLINEAATRTLNGQRIRIVGVDDLTGGQPDHAHAFAAEPPMPTLVLAHGPGQRRLVPPGARADLMLCGHTHGGQITLAGWSPVVPTGSDGYVAGWYRDPSGPPMYVSRGLGTSAVPVRFGAVPELACFDWHVPSA